MYFFSCCKIRLDSAILQEHTTYCKLLQAQLVLDKNLITLYTTWQPIICFYLALVELRVKFTLRWFDETTCPEHETKSTPKDSVKEIPCQHDFG